VILLLAFIAVPIVEIALFIQVGGAVGLWPTIALVILSAVVGAAVLRRQGLSTLADIRADLEGGRDPSTALAHGALLLVAGLLLLTPGFFTDMIGILLLVRPLRAAILARVAGRIQVMGGPGTPPEDPYSGRRSARPDVVDGEFHEIPPGSPGIPPSGWTRH